MKLRFSCEFQFSDKLWEETLRKVGGDRHEAMKKLYEMVDTVLRDEGTNQAQMQITEVA